MSDSTRSDFFRDQAPQDNEAFEHVVWTPRVAGDSPRSLEAMRQRMLMSEPFAAGVFIGGMEGVEEEFDLFRASTGSPGASGRLYWRRRLAPSSIASRKAFPGNCWTNRRICSSSGVCCRGSSHDIRPGIRRAATPTAARRPRQHAVVFSGNGYNAAYEVGVLKALLHGVSPSTREEKIQPHIYTGTSVGAYTLPSWYPARAQRHRGR